MSGVIDEFFIALGYKMDPGGLAQVRQNVAAAKSSILSLGNAFRVVVGGAAVAGVAKLGSEFESNKIAMAGFLSSLGLSSDFNAGLKDADATMQSIIKAAAALPGEADEYIGVFRAGITVLKGAMPGANLAQMTDFTNNFTALGKTLGVDAPQIGRDLNMMMGPIGRAGMQVRTFTSLLPFLKEIPGQADLTTESFNRLTQPQRMKLMQQVLANPNIVKMIEAMSSSFDAMWGSAKSAVTMLARFATVPLFEGMKKGLDRFSATFFNAKGELTGFAKRVVEVGKEVSGWIVQMVESGAGIVSWLVDLKGGAKAAMIAGLLMFTVWLFPMLALGLAIALIVEDFYTFKKGGESVIGMLAEKFGPAIEVIKALLWGAGAAMVAWAAVTAVQSALMIPQLIRIGLATLLMNGALLLPLLAIAALGAAGYELWDNWKVISQGLKDLWADLMDTPFIRALKVINDPFHNSFAKTPRQGTNMVPQAGGAAGPGPVQWQNPATHLTETHPAGWQPPTASMSGAEYASSMGSASSTHDDAVSHLRAMLEQDAAARIANSNFSTNNGPVTINITAPDAEAAGKAVEKVIKKDQRTATRNAQTRKVL